VNAPEGRVYGPLTLAVGLALLAMGIALSVQTIASVVGPFDFVGSAATGTPTLGVWLPGSAGYDTRAETRRRARSWRAALGARIRVREGGSLESLIGQGVSALAVSDARGLSAAELASLTDYVRGGGSAIVTGSVAVRGPEGEWLGTQAMARLLGVPRVVALAREASRGLAAVRRGPLSAGLASGQQLALDAEEGAPAIEDPAAELRWAGDEPSGPQARAARGASLRREIGAGRLVWLGAGPDRSAAGATAPGGDFARLVAATFAWAAREPYAEVLAPVAGLTQASGGSRLPPEAPDLAAEVSRVGSRRHRVDVTNRGRTPARGGVVRVHLNTPVERLALQRTVLQQDEPRFHFDPRAQHVDVRLPELAAGRSLAYSLDLDPADAEMTGDGA
jgi:hypothetical protein